MPGSAGGRAGRRAGEYRGCHLVERLGGVDGRRPGCAQPVLVSGQEAAYVLARVPGTAPLVVLARIQPYQHGGLIDLQQEHLGEAIGQLQLIVRAAAQIQCGGRCGADQVAEASRIPLPAMPGELGKIRLGRLFCHHGTGRVNEPRQERVLVVIDAGQAPPGKHLGDRGLPGPGTTGDQHCAHRCLSSASPGSGATSF